MLPIISLPFRSHRRLHILLSRLQRQAPLSLQLLTMGGYRSPPPQCIPRRLGMLLLYLCSRICRGLSSTQDMSHGWATCGCNTTTRPHNNDRTAARLSLSAQSLTTIEPGGQILPGVCTLSGGLPATTDYHFTATSLSESPLMTECGGSFFCSFPPICYRFYSRFLFFSYTYFNTSACTSGESSSCEPAGMQVEAFRIAFFCLALFSFFHSTCVLRGGGWHML
jgi:hypothetical protein